METFHQGDEKYFVLYFVLKDIDRSFDLLYKMVSKRIAVSKISPPPRVIFT